MLACWDRMVCVGFKTLLLSWRLPASFTMRARIGKGARVIVIARNHGQLGNRLFLYAHFIAAAREYGVRLANPGFGPYAHFFPSTADDLWCRYPCCPADRVAPSPRTRRIVETAVSRSVRLLHGSGLSSFPCRVIRVKGDQTFDLDGQEFAKAVRGRRPILTLGWLFRCEPLLMKHAAAVRQHFQIASEHRRRVRQKIESIRRESDVIVGVHIRQGDYATYLDGKYFFSVRQYARAMRDIRRQLGNRRVAFLVCSNVRVDRREFDDLQVHMGVGHVLEDMYALARADLLIGPPSTYTGWASFYGEVPLMQMHAADQPLEVPALRPSPHNRVA